MFPFIIFLSHTLPILYPWNIEIYVILVDINPVCYHCCVLWLFVQTNAYMCGRNV